MQLTFKSLAEDHVGGVWKQVFDHGWPGWKEWYVSRGAEAYPPIDVCRRHVRRFMPGYEKIWDQLVEGAGGDEDAARFLSFWDPPRYLVNCSQAVLNDVDGPMLVRNYDLDPMLNEGTLLKTKWRNRRVMGMVEGMAGLSDGMNDAGLAISLTFGGRAVTRKGFGIPMILRYVLESCRDVQDALAVLREIPSHMSYNVTVLDKTGATATVMLAPDRPVIVADENWATNHQLGVEWPRHGRLSQTLERGEYLSELVKQPGLTANKLADEFLRPPLNTRGYDEGFGTVFTAVYRPADGVVYLGWADGAFHRWSFDDFPRRELSVHYSEHGSKASVTDHTNSVAQAALRLQAMRYRNQLETHDDWSNLNPVMLPTEHTGDYP
ncbi:MAG: hypothetical protein GY947_22215 [Rhodobacteraceae bacterium]|nr:hypothetical protein [Paracoccaceae bacterium]